MKKPFFYQCLFMCTWIYSVIFNVADWDLWARMAVGKMFFQLGTVLKRDIFSYTPVKDIWIDHEWGSGVIFYFLSHHFGDLGLMMLKIIGTFIIIVLITKIVELQNIKPKTHLNLFFYILILAATFHGVGIAVRCQLFTFILFALWIYVLELVRRGNNRLLWILPATMLIWTNLHGGFVSGIGLLLIYGTGEFLNKKSCKKYFLILIPTILVTFINPYGVKYLSYIIHATTMPRPTIVEWKPTNLFGPTSQWKGFKILFFLSLITLIFSFIKNKLNYKILDKVKYLLILITAFLALKHIKHHTFFVIVAGSFLYHDFYAIFSFIRDFIVSKFGETADKILKYMALGKNIMLYIIITFVSIVWMYYTPIKLRMPEDTYPLGSIEFVKQNNLKGNLLTVFHWGSYTIWKLCPQCMIALDGRYEEVYPEDLHMMVYNFNYIIDKNWYDFIKKYHTDIIIVEKKNESYSLMLNNKDWKNVYSDKISAVFMPAGKAKKSYIIPKYTEEYIEKERYNTSIGF
ncbi:MAG: hypothetical protein V2B14_01000 [bacterium]